MASEGQTEAQPGLERDATLRAPFTDYEVEQFTEKLKAWGDALPEREQELLARLVTGATTDEENVGGYMFGAWSAMRATLAKRISTTAVAQDVTVNKAKTADKAFNAMDGYIRG